MSQYGDTNPHFWSSSQPDFAAPQHIQPEPRRSWDGHPDQVQQPDMIQLRPRQRQTAPHPPPPPVRPPRSPPEHAHQQPPSPPRHHRPVPVTHFHPVEGPDPYPITSTDQTQAPITSTSSPAYEL
ncbi:hypothetical protein BVRB_6g147040 [Beta vulgaris subsp. vulgaris]|nr:hypothetical protein BVRB_6g147040 [Beta vulgaris subsp. vulgaris]